jgi:hypothetical protein
MSAVCFEKTANFIQDSFLHLAKLCDANITVLLSTKNAEDPTFEMVSNGKPIPMMGSTSVSFILIGSTNMLSALRVI